MTSTILLEERLVIPMDIRCLADFRRWAHSEEFPETGRIDYVAGHIEVDMSPEDLFCHAAPKGEIYVALSGIVKPNDLGHLFIDRTRISSVPGDLSAEPDIVFVSWQSLESGEIQLIPKAGKAEDRYVELQGGPDLVVEILSDSSVGKDSRRLPRAYFAAGVKEFWLVDARGADLVFQIQHRGESAFEPTAQRSDGFQRSEVISAHFHLTRRKGRMNLWQYSLHVSTGS